jgi:3-oxoacyl-[acyl-carrier protein] reductase
VIPSMKKARRGRIINISSVAARTGGGSLGVMYASSKAAISAFTKGLAKELAPFGILVNGVAPGVITTRFHDRYSSSERREEYKHIIPLGREGTPEEVANCVLFMASNLSSYMTGEMMEINGGMLMD